MQTYQASSISNKLIHQILNKVDKVIDEKQMQYKLAPKLVNKQALYTFESLIAMQSANQQLRGQLATFQKQKGIKLDALSPNKIVRQTKQTQLPSKIKIKQKNSIKNESKLSSLHNSVKVSSKQNKSRNKNPFIRLNTTDIIHNQETQYEIEAIKNRKFYLQAQKETEAQRFQQEIKNYQQRFKIKKEMFKKIQGKCNYGYDGETMQQNQTLLPQPIPVHEVRVSVINQRKMSFKNKIIQGRLKTLDYSKQDNLNIQTQEIRIDRTLDPIQKLDHDDISEGVRISNTTTNVQKVKLIRQSSKLEDFKKKMKKNKFRQFGRFNPNQSRSKTEVASETIDHDRNCETDHRKEINLKGRDKCKSLRSQSLKSSRMKSLLYRSIQRNLKFGTIQIKSDYAFSQMFPNQSQLEVT